MTIIEQVVIDYLQEALETDNVYAEEPDGDTLKEYIVVEKTGSDNENYIHKSTVAIRSYGESLHDAMILNSRVCEAMNELWIKSYLVTSSDLNSDYNFSDTERQRYRYQAVYDLTHY